jgi:hypothetical protein
MQLDRQTCLARLVRQGLETLALTGKRSGTARGPHKPAFCLSHKREVIGSAPEWIAPLVPGLSADRSPEPSAGQGDLGPIAALCSLRQCPISCILPPFRNPAARNNFFSSHLICLRTTRCFIRLSSSSTSLILLLSSHLALAFCSFISLPCCNHAARNSSYSNRLIHFRTIRSLYPQQEPPRGAAGSRECDWVVTDAVSAPRIP